jgi:hypothetical protein
MHVAHRYLLRICFLVLFAAVITAMVVPYSVLQVVVSQFICIRRTMDFLDTLGRGVDLDHLVSFGAVGFAAHLGWRHWRAWQVAIGALIVASVAELVQIWMPGREPEVLHAILGVIGAVAGFSLAWLLTYAWGKESLPDYKPAKYSAGESSER